MGPPGPVWSGAETFVPTGIRSPARPARSASLYRLRYPGPRITGIVLIKTAVKVFKIGNISVVPMTAKWAIQSVISSLCGI